MRKRSVRPNALRLSPLRPKPPVSRSKPRHGRKWHSVRWGRQMLGRRWNRTWQPADANLWSARSERLLGRSWTHALRLRLGKRHESEWDVAQKSCWPEKAQPVNGCVAQDGWRWALVKPPSMSCPPPDCLRPLDVQAVHCGPRQPSRAA